MALTLIEQSKLVQDPLQKGIIEVFPRVSPVLELLPFMSVSSDSYRYNREQNLPSSGFRAVNQDYDEDTGSLDLVIESLAICGGVSDVDRALVKTQGNINDIRSIHDGMKAKSCALYFQKSFFKGDVLTDPRQFDGLQARLSGDQLIAAGNTASGSTLTLPKLDELIDAVEGGPDVLFMNKTMRRKVNTLIRAAGQAIETVSGAFGQRLEAYAGIPIRVIEVDETNTEVLRFNEVCTSGSALGTSIYAVKFGEGTYCGGLQCGPLEAIDMGLYAGGVKYRTLIEWIVGFSLFHPKSAARLWSISNS